MASSTECLNIANELLKKINSDKMLFNYPCTTTLLLVDRSIDQISPLIHTLSYQALLFDLLHMTNNIVSINNTKYSLISDNFYENNKNRFWPEVVSNMHSEVMKVTQIEKKLKNDISNFICEFSDFEKSKNEIMKHFNIISEITNIITRDRLQEVYELESQIIKGYSPEIQHILNDPNVQCKDRLFKLAKIHKKSTKLELLIDSFIEKPDFVPVIHTLIQQVKNNTLDYIKFPVICGTNIPLKNNIIICFVDGVSIPEITLNTDATIIGSHIFYN